MTTTLPPSGDTPAELAEHLASGARLVEAFHLMPGVARAMREAARLLRKPCTCHPDDNPPVPCPQKYALTECREAADKESLAAENERLRGDLSESKIEVANLDMRLRHKVAEVNHLEGEVERLRARLAEWEQRAGVYMDERDSALARLAEAERLIQCLLDNDPSDDAADAVTVYMVWRKDAERFMGAASQPHDNSGNVSVQANLASTLTSHPSLSPTHYCVDCGALWRQCDDFSMNLRSPSCCDACNNAPVGPQIRPLYVAPTTADQPSAALTPSRRDGS